MTSAKQKNAAALVALTLYYLIYLLNHFSVAGLGVTAITILYLMLQIFPAGKGDRYGIVDVIGHYFGATVFHYLFVSLFGSGFTFNDFLSYFMGGGEGVSILVIGAIMFFVLKRFHNKQTGKEVTRYIWKYGGLAVGSLVLAQANERLSSPVQIYVFVGFCAITLYVELIHKKYRKSTKGDVAYYWSIINIVLFSVIQNSFPEVTWAILVKFTNLAQIHWKWYMILLFALVILALGVYCRKVDTEEKKFPVDTKLCLVLGTNILMIPYITGTYTKYAMVAFLAIAVLDVLVFFARPKANAFFTIANRQFVKMDTLFVIGMAALAILHRGFLNGWMYGAAILMAGTVCAVLLYNFRMGASGWLFWEFIVAVVAMYTCEIVYRSYNSEASFKYIIAVTAIAALVLAIMNVRNEKKPTGNRGIKLAIVIFASIMILFPVKNQGVEYKVTVDNKIAQTDENLAAAVGESNTITVKVKARGKKNSVKKCYYYWNGDASGAVEVNLDGKSKIKIPAQNGSLHIYGEDKYGVSSKLTKWFDFR